MGAGTRALAVGASAWLLATGGPATPQEPRATLEVDTTLINVGDPIPARLVVDHAAGWVVRWPDSLDLAPFEVLRYDVADPGPAPSGEGVRSGAQLVVTSFELGELEIPSIEVAVAAPDGTERTLLTDPFRVGVESVGLDESGDIRDIKGPLAVPRHWWWPALWLLCAAGAVAGGYYLYWRLRRRPVAEAPVPLAPARPYHVVALEALDVLEASALLDRGQVKSYHIRISEIIRAYVEGQLEVPALEMTTREVVQGLRRAALSGDIAESFHAFLDRCDLVKFAKLRPGARDSRALMGTARSLVEMTSGTGAREDSDRQAHAAEQSGRDGDAADRSQLEADAA